MSEAILGAVAVVGVIAATILILHTLARRSAPAVDGGASASALAARTDRQPSEGSRERAALADPTAWQSAVVSDLSAAEELLDRAEQEGYRERELVVVGNSTFLVRWRNRT
jgi:hypothetical protein